MLEIITILYLIDNGIKYYNKIIEHDRCDASGQNHCGLCLEVAQSNTARFVSTLYHKNLKHLERQWMI